MTVADPARSWRVAVDGASVGAVFDPPVGGDLDALFVCAHGAGGHMADKSMLAAAGALCARGLGIVRFNFVYREKNSRRPDPMSQLQVCVAAVASQARGLLEPRTLLLGGRSMGGRAASMLVAGGFACDGLLLLAYPLHPAGQPSKLRDAHLADIAVPVLCFNGTRDPLCDPAMMNATLERLSSRWTMHWLDGADHSFHVLKSSGRSDADVLNEVGEATRDWLMARMGAAR